MCVLYACGIVSGAIIDCVAGTDVMLVTVSSLERASTVWNVTTLTCVSAASMPAALPRGFV